MWCEIYTLRCDLQARLRLDETRSRLSITSPSPLDLHTALRPSNSIPYGRPSSPASEPPSRCSCYVAFSVLRFLPSHLKFSRSIALNLPCFRLTLEPSMETYFFSASTRYIDGMRLWAVCLCGPRANRGVLVFNSPSAPSSAVPHHDHPRTPWPNLQPRV
jgi:hypothetical protein